VCPLDCKRCSRSNDCDECADGKTRIESQGRGTCIVCPKSCRRCSGDNRCEECADGFQRVLFLGRGVCIKRRPAPPVDCVPKEWREWEKCSWSCADQGRPAAGGTRSRYRNTIPAENGGRQCDRNEVVEEEPCNTDLQCTLPGADRQFLSVEAARLFAETGSDNTC